MLDLIAHNLAPIMFVTVMAMLLIGYPVALTLAAGGLFFFVVGVALSEISPGEINLFWPLLGAQPERVFGIMSNDTLLAIPFFTFMGLILERSGMAEDLLDTIGQLFGPVRGGLAYAVILVGALLAATTGVVAASVIAMGLISLPIMQRFGYAQPAATGTIVASGTLAQIVPPSLVLIVMADQLGVSVGDMYLGAIWPSLMLIGLYCLYVFVLSIVAPSAVPALPASERTLGSGLTSLVAAIAAAAAIYYVAARFVFDGLSSGNGLVASAATAAVLIFLFALINQAMNLRILSHLADKVIIVLIPPLALIFLVLGTIFLGIATPTEGGAMGAVGALILAAAKRRLDFPMLKSSVESTATLSAFVMFILIGARVFGLTFYGVNGNVWLEELLLAIPGGEYGFLVVITILVFILGCFPRFLRDRIHPGAAARAGRVDAGDRPGLVRDHPRHQPAGQLPDAALRLLAVLPPLRGAGASLDGHAHRPPDATDHHHRDLQGRDSLHRDQRRGDPAGDRLPLPRHPLQGDAGRGAARRDSGRAARGWRARLAPDRRRGRRAATAGSACPRSDHHRGARRVTTAGWACRRSGRSRLGDGAGPRADVSVRRHPVSVAMRLRRNRRPARRRTCRNRRASTDLGGRRKTRKGPPENPAGPFLEPVERGDGQPLMSSAPSRCLTIMKVSKLYSATCCHR